MSKVNLALALVVLMAVSLSCTFLKGKVMNGGKPASEFDKVARLPIPDLKATLPSPGAVAVRELAKIDPAGLREAAGRPDAGPHLHQAADLLALRA